MLDVSWECIMFSISKKVIFSFVVAFLMVIFSFADEKENSDLFYVPTYDEFGYFVNYMNFLQAWENDEVQVSDEEFENIYKEQIGSFYFSSKIFEMYFKSTNNPKIKSQIKKYIQKNNLNDEYAKALLKKLDSVRIERKENEKVLNQYVYNDEEYDENIILSSLTEIHPFDDEFGMLLFNNDYNVLRWKNFNNEKVSDSDEKQFYLMTGGGTNSMLINLKEYLNVENEDSAKELFNLGYFENKYKENWFFTELEQKGVLSNCGVEHYYIGYGIGPDIIPEISCGDFVAFLYSEKLKKVFIVDIFMNFSKININYEIRNQIYDYLKFFTLFCYCDS